MAEMKIGDPAPEFEMMNQAKQTVRLSDFRGRKKVVLLFYPMDFSPVCTEEHCAFGPQLGKITSTQDAVVFGVSCDSPFCHAAFKKQYSIPYELLSDVTRNVSKAYNLFMGELPYNCSKRGTVVIAKDGRVAHYHEQPMRDPRSVEDLEKASMIEDLLEQRDNEGGERTSASR